MQVGGECVSDAPLGGEQRGRLVVARQVAEPLGQRGRVGVAGEEAGGLRGGELVAAARHERRVGGRAAVALSGEDEQPELFAERPVLGAVHGRERRVAGEGAVERRPGAVGGVAEGVGDAEALVGEAVGEEAGDGRRALGGGCDPRGAAHPADERREGEDGQTGQDAHDGPPKWE